jgi:hypothetical protein
VEVLAGGGGVQAEVADQLRVHLQSNKHAYSGTIDSTTHVRV